MPRQNQDKWHRRRSEAAASALGLLEAVEPAGLIKVTPGDHVLAGLVPSSTDRLSVHSISQYLLASILLLPHFLAFR